MERLYRLWCVLLGAPLSELEAVHAEQLLEQERTALCRKVAGYNRGLAGTRR